MSKWVINKRKAINLSEGGVVAMVTKTRGNTQALDGYYLIWDSVRDEDALSGSAVSL